MTINQLLMAYRFLFWVVLIIFNIFIVAYKQNVKKTEKLEEDYSILEVKYEDLKDKLKEYESKADTF